MLSLAGASPKISDKMPTLRIKLPDESEVTHVLMGERISVGRRPDNTIQILDRSVSAHHAELILVDGHYRLHDLASTNFSFVDGTQVTDFHLHNSCKVRFGNIECEFDATPSAEEPQLKLTPAQMEKDIAFLRAENQDLLNKIDGLQRRIDILSSARLITGRTDSSVMAGPDLAKKVAAERDELRFQISGLRLELEKLREELSVTIRERDAARQANELLQAERATNQTLSDAAKLGDKDKGMTQRIHVFSNSGDSNRRAETEGAEKEPLIPIEAASK